MEKQFLIVSTADRSILCSTLLADPDAGPVLPVSAQFEGYEMVEYAGEFSRAGRRETEVPFWRDGIVIWEEMASLEELRAERNAAINAWKLEANSSYFDFRGERIAFKPSDQIEIQAVHNWVTLTGTMPNWPDWPGAWKAMSNKWVPLPDIATWTEFTLAIASRGTAHFKRAQTLKAELAAATTAAEIEAIQW